MVGWLKRERKGKKSKTREKQQQSTFFFFFFTFSLSLSLSFVSLSLSFVSLSLSVVPLSLSSVPFSLCFPLHMIHYTPHLMFAGTASSIILGLGRFSDSMIATNSASLFASPSLGVCLFSSPIAELVIPL